jgi:hypothetical protein
MRDESQTVLSDADITHIRQQAAQIASLNRTNPEAAMVQLVALSNGYEGHCDLVLAQYQQAAGL